MIFKIQKLEPTVCLVRGYSKPEDVKFNFVCTLHHEKDKKGWHIHGAMSNKGTIKEAREMLKFLEEFPDGTYTWVSEEDFERFYKKHYFSCIDLTKKKKRKG